MPFEDPHEEEKDFHVGYRQAQIVTPLDVLQEKVSTAKSKH